jgi:heme/copper-type cytochrome/quinol oxidase subunit 2
LNNDADCNKPVKYKLYRKGENILVTLLYIFAGIVAFFFILVVIGITSLLGKKDRQQFDGTVTKEATRFVFIFALLLFVFFFIYPTPYRYLTFKDVPVKYNWLNGKTEILKLNESELQWVELNVNK